jgi:lipoprotein-releasing system ATP-binding protein
MQATPHQDPSQQIPEADIPALVLDHVRLSYLDAERRLDVLRDIAIEVMPGQTVALIAPSGTGKSTLLHVSGLLERPDAGEVRIGGVACSALNDAARTEIRRTDIGFIYQQHRLLPEFTAVENVALPQMINGLSRSDAEDRARQILGFLGFGERLTHRPSELSGGEQQRVAIARAVSNRPRLLLADEPTGNLDPVTSGHVFDTLLTLARVSRLAAVIATHNLELAMRMDRRVTLRDGMIVELP